MERSFQAAMLLHDPEVVFVLGECNSLIHADYRHIADMRCAGAMTLVLNSCFVLFHVLATLKKYVKYFSKNCRALLATICVNFTVLFYSNQNSLVWYL